MDLCFLKYDFREEIKQNCYSWQKVLFALENKIITVEDVIEYATYILDENTRGFDIVLEITCSNNDEDIYPYLQDLIQLEESQDTASIKNKWLYLILKWLYEKRNEIDNVLQIIEEIYELFDYPDSIISFVGYMPSDAGDLGSPKLNGERLFKNWEQYLTTFEEEHLFL